MLDPSGDSVWNRIDDFEIKLDEDRIVRLFSKGSKVLKIKKPEKSSAAAADGPSPITVLCRKSAQAVAILMATLGGIQQLSERMLSHI